MKRAKRFLSLFLAFCMVVGMAPAVLAAESGLPFRDVKATDWYYSAVSYAYENGMMGGTGGDAFSPDAATTRGMIVTILHRLEGTPAAEGTAFSDVAAGAYYANAVAWASENGIVGGYGNGKFGPDDPITREQLAAILYRYAQYAGRDVSVGEDTNILSYTDFSDLSEWAIPAMQWACGAGLITGLGGGVLNPKGNATRAQAAAILMRFCEDGDLEEAGLPAQTVPGDPVIPTEPENPSDSETDLAADEDKDGVSDAVEEFFGTSPETDDTDGDGLTDYTELYDTDTDPTVADSDEDGIPDGEADCDGDGLTNAEEQAAGTSSKRTDTDGDGLTDGEEVKTYGTDPLQADTDSDGLTDGDEILLGLDPRNPKTDGVTLDSERTFPQTTDDSVMDETLASSDSWLTPSVSGTVPGLIEKNIRMNAGSVYALDSNRSVVSDIVDVYTAYDVPVTLKFRYSRTYTGEMNNLNVMTYTEDGLAAVDTFIDEDAKEISAAVSESGTYFVLDLDEFLKGLGINVFEHLSTEEPAAVSAFSAKGVRAASYSVSTLSLDDEPAPAAAAAASGATGKADVVFVVDTTGSMSSAISGVKNNIGQFSSALVNDYHIDVNFALIEYRDITVDGEDSTILHKNVSGNWFTNVNGFINEVNSLTVGGGGDLPETPIDGLEMARTIDWRGDAVKFVILVTDAGYKNDNLCGIASMDEMSRRLVDSGIITSVIAASESTYEILTEPSGGLYGNIYEDFSKVLLLLANMVGEATNTGGEWVFLSDFQAVKLSDTLENAETNDTDHDGYSDARELGVSKEVDMSDQIELLLRKNSIPADSYTGKKTLLVWDYVSNPTLLDTDFDGISDGTLDYDGSTVAHPDENPRRLDSADTGIPATRQKDGNRFRGEVTANDFTFDVSFKMDYTLFFGDLSKYKRNLSKLGIIYSIGAYHEKFDIDYGADFNGDAKVMMENFGMKNVTNVKLADTYTDDDLSEMTIGHREVTYQGVTKDIIFVAVRGTDATIEEWSSNFDVGADTSEYWDRYNSDWENRLNHKGFDVAANRLDEFLSDYISEQDSSAQKVLFFTGHSRGAAIANIMAAMYVDKGYQTVAYTMATPNTTLQNNVSSYKTIFNIVNEDDLVPYLPLEDWGYEKFGKTYSVSIEASYEDKFGGYDDGTWEAMFGCDYNYNGNLNKTLKAFSKIVDDRDELYVFTGESNTKYTYGTKYKTESDAATAAYALRDRYGDRISQFCKFYTVENDPLFGDVYYQVMVEQSPAAMMMILTDVVASKQHTWTDSGKDQIKTYTQRGAGEDTFAGQDVGFYVAKKYQSAKKEFVWSGSDSASDLAMSVRMGGMLHAHMCGTYYLIVCDGKDLLP